ncbi:hypothetical protein [Nostoc sp.]
MLDWQNNITFLSLSLHRLRSPVVSLCNTTLPDGTVRNDHCY